MRQLPAADRRTLLRLMSDECYQQTKLGAAFPPSKQQRSGQFWLLAAAYLEQPVLSVVLAGACLRAEADALRLQQRQRQRQRQEREAVLPSVPGAAARRQPQVAAATTDTAAAAERALLMPAVETAAAGGSSDGSKRRRKDKEERLRRKAEAAEAAAAAERGSSGPAQAPPGAAELPQRLAKKRRRQKVGSGDTRSPPAALPSTPALAAAAEEQQPAKKKRRREAGSNQPAEAGKGEEFRNVNFPQLLEDAALEQQLRGLADVPALKAFLATWLAQQWPQLEAAMLAGRAAALDRYIAANSKRRGVYRHGAGWQASIGLQGKTCGLGTFPTEEEAGVVRDIASVWRSLHFRSTKASQLYNQPQLRLWEDAALVTSLRGVQSSAQLQSFLKAWAEQHLPAVVARLA
ncbi:hypothetical protein C2E21_4871 [Chlorella sorokiniana]|uniref:Uncharacterized protein n=1 Tax=Chlorella sorokiniana TaxID=3076 RepID=A0A2P6TQI4_CHLSO|nr:hypothetical protein C2E21_4871 [Chlorella sorokiniana]|eukprot:PRW56295.1 hypothetical protein C2E21_4871 [Chlorella sorokiniana]